MKALFSATVQKKAGKKFLSFSKKQQLKISKTISLLEQDPLTKQLNIKKMVGTANSWRVRVGNIRILYTFDSKKKIILVFKIDFRGSIYN